MTFLIILGVILLLLAAILFLPVGVLVKFRDDFRVKIKFAGITVYKINTDETEQPEKKDTEKDKKTEEKDENQAKKLFTRLKDKHGFSGAVKSVMSFLLTCLTHIKKLLRHIKVKDIRLNITVGTEDAAKTAVEYGAVCTAVYPVLSLLDTCRNINFKKIAVKSDFTHESADFDFSLTVTMQIFFVLIAAFKILGEYKKFISEEDIQ